MMGLLKLVIFESVVKEADGISRSKFIGIPSSYFETEEAYNKENVMNNAMNADLKIFGIDSDAKIYDVVKLIRYESSGIEGVRAWDEQGKAWYTTANDYIWVRDFKYDRFQPRGKEDEEDEY